MKTPVKILIVAVLAVVVVGAVVEDILRTWKEVGVDQDTTTPLPATN